MPRSPLVLFLDSGAFTALRQRKPIDQAAYLDFLQGPGSLFAARASLDAIPTSRTPRATEEAARASWETWEWLKGFGVDVFPTYHRGERPEWLKRILEARPSLLGLGGLVGVPDKERRRWLRETLRTIPPSQPVHVFGVSDFAVLKGLRVTSVDSSSWLIGASSGWVPVVDEERNRRWLVKFQDVGNSPHSFDRLSEREQAEILRLLDARGARIELLRSSYHERRFVWASTQKVEASLAIGFAPVFLLQARPNQDEPLRRARVTHRLLSYAHCRRLTLEQVTDFRVTWHYPRVRDEAV